MLFFYDVKQLTLRDLAAVVMHVDVLQQHGGGGGYHGCEKVLKGEGVLGGEGTGTVSGRGNAMHLEGGRQAKSCGANHEDERGVALLGQYHHHEYVEGQSEKIHDLHRVTIDM